MKRRTSLTTRLGSLRDAFDSSFAAPDVERPVTPDNFLAIRLGRRTHAVPLQDIAGLFAQKPVTRLPTSDPALLGLANLSGAIVPVFDLHLLLGLKAAERPAWLVVASSASVAFAFEGFEGHLRVVREDIIATDESGEAGNAPQQSIRTNGATRPVVRLPSIIGAIERRIAKG